MIYLILAIIIFFISFTGIINPGGITLLDYVSTNHDVYIFGQNAWFLFPQVFAWLVGYEWGTKICFVFILIVAALLGKTLASELSYKILGKSSVGIELLGGLFFLINPFAYERMMTQPVIYLGVMLIGWGLYFGYRYYQDGNIHDAIYVGILFGLSINLFLHAGFIVLLVGLLGFSLFIGFTHKSIYHGIIVGIMMIIMNLNWVGAIILGFTTPLQGITTFSLSNLEAFRTQALAPLDVWGTNLLLYGFWGERYASHYVRVDILSSLWYIAGFILVGLMIYGYYRFYQGGRRRETWIFGALGGLSLIFGIGIASPLTEGLTRWMIEYIPLWQGYREPQKWIGLLMIVEGIGFILGTVYLLERFQKDRVVRGSIITTILLLLMIWSPGPLLGYHGQLRTTIYPSEFESVRAELLSQSGAKVLALPWHAYIGCAWMGRPIVSNPIKGLLGGVEVISSDNIEVANILYSNSMSLESSIIESFIGSGSHDISPLQERGFSHILLMKQCANSHRYEWLDTLPSCQKSSESGVHTLYHCQ